jgi:hypothetical protein
LHQALDAAVTEASDRPADISGEDALAALFELNQTRATVIPDLIEALSE